MATMSRRQALTAMLATGATAGAAWTIPEVITAKPTAAATLSTPPGVMTPQGPALPAAKPGKPLAFTGDNIERDTLAGLGLIGVGWAVHHWAPRVDPVVK